MQCAATCHLKKCFRIFVLVPDNGNYICNMAPGARSNFVLALDETIVLDRIIIILSWRNRFKNIVGKEN